MDNFFGGGSMAQSFDDPFVKSKATIWVPHRLSIALYAAIVCGAAWLLIFLLVTLNTPLLDAHAFRQTQTANFVRNSSTYLNGHRHSERAEPQRWEYF
jgi:hypothetical protein